MPYPSRITKLKKIPQSLKSLSEKKGITLLLVIAILSALLSISIGIFNSVFGQIQISGETTDSFRALYGADQSIERFLYLDRVTGKAFNDGDTEDNTAIESNYGCYKITIYKDASPGGSIESMCKTTGVATCLKGIGQYRCGANPSRAVKRAFVATY